MYRPLRPRYVLSINLLSVTADTRLGHEDYGGRFDVDMETEMLGSVKPHRRQVRTRAFRVGAHRAHVW